MGAYYMHPPALVAARGICTWCQTHDQCCSKKSILSHIGIRCTVFSYIFVERQDHWSASIVARGFILYDDWCGRVRSRKIIGCAAACHWTINTVLLMQKNSSNNDCSPLELYTIDPSRGWRSCVGQGTALERGAVWIRAAFLHLASVNSRQGSFGRK